MTFDSANKGQRPNTESSDANLPDVYGAMCLPAGSTLPRNLSGRAAADGDE